MHVSGNAFLDPVINLQFIFLALLFRKLSVLMYFFLIVEKRETGKVYDELCVFKLQLKHSIYWGENIITKYSVTLFYTINISIKSI